MLWLSRLEIGVLLYSSVPSLGDASRVGALPGSNMGLELAGRTE